MRRMGTIVAAMALGLAGLVGCSGGDQKYCDTLKDQQKNSTDLQKEFQGAMKDPEKAKAALAKADGFITKAADAAPDDKIKGDWEKIGSAFDTMKPLFDKLPELQKAMKDPTKADPQLMKDIQQLQPKMTAAGKDIQTASDSLQKDAKKRCDIDLNKMG